MPGLKELIEGALVVIVLPAVAGIVLSAVWPYAWVLGGLGALVGAAGLYQGFEEEMRKR